MPRPPVRLLGYHPKNLCYRLIEDSHFNTAHPDEPGDSTPAVGVHRIAEMIGWEQNMKGEVAGGLLWHPVTLSQWTATRAEFSSLPEADRWHHSLVGPAARKGRWATHLGATLAVLTSDGKTVLRSREGKYAETHLYDSLIAGTMLTEHIKGKEDPLTIDYLRHLLYEANISLDRDVEDLHPTHLAVRVSDSGLWLGGWIRVGLTASQVSELVPFRTLTVELDSTARIPMTDWGRFDLEAMRTHLDGGELLERTWLP